MPEQPNILCIVVDCARSDKWLGRDRRTVTPVIDELARNSCVFPNTITELAIQVMMNLGEVANPVTGETRQDLEHAKHTIDLLGVLQEKTTGNLDPEEETALNQYLYDLRMKYVRACGT